MNAYFSSNPFDIAIYACLFLAVVMGFHAGLLYLAIHTGRP